MASQQLKVGIVGASTLLGKELSEELGRTALAAADVVLFDGTDAEGRLATAGEELTFIQKIEEATLEGLDFVFFAGPREQTLEYWQMARRNGATIIDLSRALAEEPGAITWSPWLSAVTGGASSTTPDLHTTVVVPAYGASMMLALVGDRLLAAKRAARLFAATLLLPASEFDRPGMDELHQQTVSLLSFQPVPQEVFEAQVAFNVLGAFGAEAKVSLEEEHASVVEEYERLGGGSQPELALQVVQVPVFHGYTISLFVELAAPASVAEVEEALAGTRVLVMPAGAAAPPVRATRVKIVDPESADEDSAEEEEERAESTAPSNLSAAGQEDILVRVKAATDGERGTRFWLWMAADNLRLATAAAAESALHMRRLRPQGKVQ